MRVLTVRQPWATLIAIGAKHIETRSWATRYRGLLAIHSSAGIRPRDAALLRQEPSHSTLAAAGITSPSQLPLGAIMAIGNLVACEAHTSAFIDSLSPAERAFGVYGEGRWGWILENVVQLSEPIPAKGRLNLWPPEGQVASRLREFVEQEYSVSMTVRTPAL